MQSREGAPERSGRYLEDDFQFDWRAERKTCHAVHHSTGILFLSKNVLQQFGRAISHFRLISNVAHRGHRNAESHDARHSIERSEMLSSDGKNIESREVSRFAS